jgi:alkanesulfonate monooxygenase SsuD/methylene tetrahydromethanopterin reductase-like flavin-dependent oxidoreductase (luciferase family)
MKVILFDLMPYGEELDHLKPAGEKELPWPLGRQHFKPEVAVRTYEEHLAIWEEMDRLGYDGVGFNEHHTSPYGLMNSPNLLAAAASQRTKRLRLLIYGNLLPIHDPLRLAEELSMIDCLSNGRLISGFARGIPREHVVYGVNQTESRARFEEAVDIVRGLWSDEVFSYEGKFWSYKDVAIWPRPVQQPVPVWIPVTSSKETIEFAARKNIPITPGAGSPGLRQDVIRHYAKCLTQNGYSITPDHLIIQANAYIADTKAQAVAEAGPHAMYFGRTLFSHGNDTEADRQRSTGYLSSSSFDYVRPENMGAVARAREDYRDITMEQIAANAERLPWGTADEAIEKITHDADVSGSNTVVVSLNRGVMPAEMFMEQVRRFGRDVLPALQAHEVTRVPLE